MGESSTVQSPSRRQFPGHSPAQRSKGLSGTNVFRASKSVQGWRCSDNLMDMSSVADHQNLRLLLQPHDHRVLAGYDDFFQEFSYRKTMYLPTLTLRFLFVSRCHHSLLWVRCSESVSTGLISSGAWAKELSHAKAKSWTSGLRNSHPDSAMLGRVLGGLPAGLSLEMPDTAFSTQVLNPWLFSRGNDHFQFFQMCNSGCDSPYLLLFSLQLQ